MYHAKHQTLGTTTKTKNKNNRKLPYANLFGRAGTQFGYRHPGAQIFACRARFRRCNFRTTAGQIHLSGAGAPSVRNANLDRQTDDKLNEQLRKTSVRGRSGRGPCEISARCARRSVRDQSELVRVEGATPCKVHVENKSTHYHQKPWSLKSTLDRDHPP